MIQIGWIVSLLALIGLGMGLIASPNINFIMQQVPLGHAGSIGGMVALTRNMGMAIGAALGLGVMHGNQVKEQVSLLAGIRSLIIINLFLCVVVIAVLGYIIRKKSRNKKSIESDVANPHSVNKEESI